MTLEEHIFELGKAFGVKLFKAPIEASGAGYAVIACPSCGQHNRLTRIGSHRCGRCKTDLGQYDEALVVRFAPVTNDFAYAVALHELGHCLAVNGMMPRSEFSHTFRTTGQYSTIRDIALQLEEERAAWTWARHHALRWSAEMDAAEHLGLSSYESAAKRILGRTP